MSTTKSLFHIVINTKNRQMTIPEQHKRELYAYIYGIIRNLNCALIRMNGIGNHIHMLINLNVEISLSQFVREIKRGSSIWLKSNELFPDFAGWGKEYYAFSCSVDRKDALVSYIKNQESHHQVVNFHDEMAEIARVNDSRFYTYD